MYSAYLGRNNTLSFLVYKTVDFKILRSQKLSNALNVSNFLPLYSTVGFSGRNFLKRYVPEESKMCWCTTAMWETVGLVLVIFIKLKLLYEIKLLACILL